jgi:hypothetical protein
LVARGHCGVAFVTILPQMHYGILCHMAATERALRTPRHEETVVLASGARIGIELWRDRAGGPCCRLRYTRGAHCLVCYEAELRAAARRQVKGRTLPYEFRSIEQLRYDFEREVEKLEAADGARA